MKLKKRFLSVILTVAMLGSSLQYPEMTLQAEELPEETTIYSEETKEQASETQDEMREGDSSSGGADDSSQPEANQPRIEAKKDITNYVVGDTIGLSDLTVTYYDGNGGKEEGVSGYDTNVVSIDMTTAGTKQLEITYNIDGVELKVTLELIVEEKPIVTQAYIEAEKTQKTYKTGDTIDLSDLTVTYYDGNGGKEEGVSGYKTNVDIIDMTTAGTKQLEITYNKDGVELKVTLELTVEENKQPYIKASKKKTSYQCGEEFKTDDLTVTYYDDTGKDTLVSAATNASSDGYTINNIDTNVIGPQKLTVTYKGLTATIDLTIVGKTAYITADKTITEYKRNEKIDLSDLTVNYYDESGAKHEVPPVSDTVSDDYTVSDFDTSRLGKRPLTVTYKGLTATVELEVIEAPHITASKTVTTYKYGDEFNLDDLTVRYYDESNKSTPIYAATDESPDGYTTNAADIKTIDAGAESVIGAEQELIITYKDMQTTIKIKVEGRKPFIRAEKEEKESKKNTAIDLSDLKVKYYSEKYYEFDKDDEEATGCEYISPSEGGSKGYTTNVDRISTDTIGKKELIITYMDLTTSVELVIFEDPYIQARKTKTTYECGDKLDLSDLTVTYYNGRGNNETVSSTRYTTNAAEIDMSTVGRKQLIITYNTLKTTINLTVNEKQVIKKDPYIEASKTKTEYEVGDKLDLSDLTVTYYDEDGKSQSVTEYTTNADQIDMGIVGKKELVITYNQLTTTIELTVIEKSEPDKTKVSAPTAEPASGTIPRGTRVILETVTEDAQIYYTTDNTEPSTNSRRYTGPIIIDRSMTVKAIAVKSGFADSDVSVFEYTVSENNEGLKIQFAEPDRVYIYTGSEVTPKIVVTNNGMLLKEGVDYTLKYSNNTNITDSARVTVTGKGNLAGSWIMTFSIRAKMLDNSDLDDKNPLKVEGGQITVLEGTKASPMLMYGGTILSNKDFQFTDDRYKNYKWQLSDNGAQFTVNGQGNFTGSRVISVKVISKEQESQCNIIVNFNNDLSNLVYNGSPRDIRSFIYISTKATPKGLVENQDYIISLPEDIISAGVKKYTVIGISDRCVGSVTKTYTITPRKANFTVEYDQGGYPYVSTGTTMYDLVVKERNRTLTEGTDYIVTYSNNKKVGTAKFTVTGVGSYEGSSYKGTFTIRQAMMDQNTVDVVAGDKIFKKPGVYKSAPYVSMNGVTLKSSEYKVTYYLDDPRTNANARVMDKKNKVTSGETRVWVKVTGKNKGNFAASGENYAVGSYMVRSKAADSIDLSKVKVTFQDKDGITVKKVGYTGYPITDLKVVVTYKTKGGTITLDPSKYNVVFTNNVNKGKAKVIITGKSGQSQYIGTKTATFSIVANKIKSSK